MAERLELCEVHSFTISPNLRQCTTVLNADVRYLLQFCSKLCSLFSDHSLAYLHNAHMSRLGGSFLDQVFNFSQGSVRLCWAV